MSIIMSVLSRAQDAAIDFSSAISSSTVFYDVSLNPKKDEMHSNTLLGRVSNANLKTALCLVIISISLAVFYYFFNNITKVKLCPG